MPRFTCGNCRKEYSAEFKQPPQGNSKRVNCPDCGWRVEESEHYAGAVDTSETAPPAAKQPKASATDEDGD